MDLETLWQWERKKLPCRVRPETGNPGRDDLQEQLAALAGVPLQDLINDMKAEKKKREAKSKVAFDHMADKNFKEVLARQHVLGGSTIALERILEKEKKKEEEQRERDRIRRERERAMARDLRGDGDNGKKVGKSSRGSGMNINKVFSTAVMSPPKRISIDIRRELAKPLFIPDKDQKDAQAAKLERRLQKQRAARMAAKEDNGADNNKKALDTKRNGTLSGSQILQKYDGDLFCTGGDYIEGIMYLSRCLDAGESGNGKFIDMKKLLREKKQLAKSFLQEPENDSLEKTSAESVEGSDLSSKLYCATSLCNWSRNPANANRLEAEGAVKAIMILSLEKLPRILVFCAGAFRYMSEQPILANRMIDDQALGAILEMIGTKADDFICGNLAIALLNLTRVNGREGQLVEDSIVLCFMNLIGQRQDLHATCCRGLYNLTCVDTNYPLIERVIRALISLSCSGVNSVKHICAAALCNLADLKGVRLRMIEEGVVSVLSSLARGSETRTRRVCAVILQNLTSSKSCRSEMVARNCVQVCYGLSSDQDPIILRCIGLTLSRLALESVNCLRIINDGGIMALCNIAVKFPTIPGISQPAAVAFQLMSSRPDIRVSIVHEGSVAAVASLLRLSHDVFTLQHGLLSLCNLLSSEDNHLPIVQQGLMSTLIALSSHQNSLLKDFCALAFFNLSCSEGSRKHIVNAGAISAIINACQSDSSLTKRRCAASLCNITSYESGIRRMVGDGIVPALCQLLVVDDIETIRYTCAALCRLSSTQETGMLIMQSGAIPHVVDGAMNGDISNKEFCCAVLSSLSYYEDCREPLAEVGGIAAIKSLSETTDDDTKKRLLVAFANLSCTPGLQQVMVNEGVVEIIAKLSDSYQEINQVCCARALCNLACTPECRSQIVKEGGVRALMMVSMVRSVDLKTKVLCVRALLNLLEPGTLDDLLEEGVVDAVSSLAKSGDPAITSFCSRLFNQLSLYEEARRAIAKRNLYLKSIFDMYEFDDLETKVIIARSSCNLLYSTSDNVLFKCVSNGVLRVLGNGFALPDPEASLQCLESLFLLSQKPQFCPTIVDSSVPFLLCDLCRRLQPGNLNKFELCLQILCNLAKDIEVRKALQTEEFWATFFEAISATELNENCYVWMSQLIWYLVYGYRNVMTLIEQGLLRHINRLSYCSNPVVMEAVILTLREVCKDAAATAVVASNGIVSILNRVVDGNPSASVFYHTCVVLYTFAQAGDVRYKVVSPAPQEFVSLLVLISKCKNIECVEILASLLYLFTADVKCRPFFASDVIADLIVSVVERGITTEAVSNVVLAIFALTKLPVCRGMLAAANVDKLLLKWSQHSAKLKVNCTNALKNLSSDAAEAIDEGTVAALIAISLEGKGGATQNDDEYDPPTILKLAVIKSETPKAIDSVPLSEFEVASQAWVKDTPAVTGDFATRGPPPPEPPRMVSESTGNYPSMVDDLDAGDMEGRTKMAFAKMQTPAELRESYVFDDADFDAQQDDDEGNVSSGDNSERLGGDSPGNENPGFELDTETNETGELSYPVSQDGLGSLSQHEAPKSKPAKQNPVPSPKGRMQRHEEREEAKNSPSAEEERAQKMTVEEKAATLGLYS